MNESEHWYAYLDNGDWWQADVSRMPVSLHGQLKEAAVAVAKQQLELRGVPQPALKAQQSVGRLEIHFMCALVAVCLWAVVVSSDIRSHDSRSCMQEKASAGQPHNRPVGLGGLSWTVPSV